MQDVKANIKYTGPRQSLPLPEFALRVFKAESVIVGKAVVTVVSYERFVEICWDGKYADIKPRYPISRGAMAPLYAAAAAKLIAAGFTVPQLVIPAATNPTGLPKPELRSPSGSTRSPSGSTRLSIEDLDDIDL